MFGTVPKGEGGQFQSKNLFCRFWTFKQGLLSMTFAKKKASWFSKNEDGSKAVWNFSENLSVLEEVGFPYTNLKWLNAAIESLWWSTWKKSIKGSDFLWAARAIGHPWIFIPSSTKAVCLVVSSFTKTKHVSASGILYFTASNIHCLVKFKFVTNR